MRAEHESEMVALKEEKQDMLLKYHATSSRLNEQERRCAEQEESMEEMRSQLVKLQLVCKRQEKKLSAGSTTATTAIATPSTDASTQKENRASRTITSTSTSSSTKSQPRDVKPKRSSSRRVGGGGGGGAEENRVSTKSQAFFSVAGAPAHGRALRGLTNAVREHRAAQAASKQDRAVQDDDGISRDDGMPPECSQS